MSMLDKIIIMLTHNDKTVPNAIELFEENSDLPIQYWGFKDVGMERDKMKLLCTKMRDAGKTSFLEVVSYTEEECMRAVSYTHLNSVRAWTSSSVKPDRSSPCFFSSPSR